MKSVLPTIGFLFLISTFGYGQSTLAIEWELVNPFRFITEKTYIDELRAAYARSDKTASGLERTLQDDAERDVKARRDVARQTKDCTKEENREECYAPYSGWFARLAERKDFIECRDSGKQMEECAKLRYSATCWESSYRRYRTNEDGPCKDYIHPQQHRVRAWISGAVLSTGQAPRWLKDGAEFNPAPCESKYGPNCVEFELKYNGNDTDSGTKASAISAMLADGTAVPPIDIFVNDRLVVGLGDSYASGEGNPDLPATFIKGRTDVDFLYGLRVRRNPQKDKNAPASWLDLGCHRSMYSYQFKTALQMALNNPKEAITFVSYACSGATTDNIIGERQDPQEQNKKKRPQLWSLNTVLQDKDGKLRPIDYLLLSTGGNDVKFSKYVAYIVTSGFIRLVSSKRPKETTGPSITKALIGGENSSYFRLREALLGKDRKVHIRGCDDINKPCPQIILTAYPDALHEGAALCEGERKEFDVPFKYDPGRKKRIINIDANVFIPLRKLQQRVPAELGWSVADDHIKDYTQHGFCAQGPVVNGSTAEIFVMPKRDDKAWKTFDPWEYKPYESRKRWLKLPIDSKLSTDQQHVYRTYTFDLFFEDDRANIMHPTAEGHARTADANILKIRNLRR